MDYEKEYKEMKSYLYLEQCKKLAKILPTGSADMFYSYNTGIESYYDNVPRLTQVDNHFVHFPEDIPCWSLSALIEILPDNVVIDGRHWFLSLRKTGISYLGSMTFDGQLHISAENDNLIDSCVDMITKLHKLNLL